MLYINNDWFIVEAEECPQWFIEYDEEKELEKKSDAEKREKIVSKYPIEEQLNVMRQTLIEICKQTWINDGEIFNMNKYISGILWRDSAE